MPDISIPHRQKPKDGLDRVPNRSSGFLSETLQPYFPWPKNARRVDLQPKETLDVVWWRSTADGAGTLENLAP